MLTCTLMSTEGWCTVWHLIMEQIHVYGFKFWKFYSHIHSSIVDNSQNVETAHASINRWMDKQNGCFRWPGPWCGWHTAGTASHADSAPSSHKGQPVLRVTRPGGPAADGHSVPQCSHTARAAGHSCFNCLSPVFVVFQGGVICLG